MGRKRRENEDDLLEGWSDWQPAMVPSLPERGQQHFRERVSNQPGYLCPDIDEAFDEYDCGIYEWQARGTEDEQPSRMVVYVGSTCRKKRGAIRDRIKEYCRDGSHKKRLINKALRNGYELWVRAKPTVSKRAAERQENKSLSEYDYAWNKRENGNRTRDILPQ